MQTWFWIWIALSHDYNTKETQIDMDLRDENDK